MLFIECHQVKDKHKLLHAFTDPVSLTWLYLNTNNQGREKLNKLFIKYPISIKFNNGLVKMFTKSSSGILTKVQGDTGNKNPFHVDYLPVVKLKYKLEHAGIKEGNKVKGNRIVKRNPDVK